VAQREYFLCAKTLEWFSSQI